MPPCRLALGCPCLETVCGDSSGTRAPLTDSRHRTAIPAIGRQVRSDASPRTTIPRTALPSSALTRASAKALNPCPISVSSRNSLRLQSERLRRKRCISSALITPEISRTLENLAKKQGFVMARKGRCGRALHLFRFCSNQLMHKASQRGRGGRAQAWEALQLYRLGVAGVPPTRHNSASQALHLSVDAPFSTIQTMGYKPLLYSSCIPCNCPLAAKLPRTRSTETAPLCEELSGQQASKSPRVLQARASTAQRHEASDDCSDAYVKSSPHF